MAVLGVLKERIQSRLWPTPALGAAVAVVLALALSGAGRTTDGRWVGDAAASRALLQVLAGSSLTVVALVFSLHVVALQLAASLYSPRLLRTYARDWAIQAAMAVLIATFAFCLVTLATFGAAPGVPEVSITVAVLLGLACVGALVGVVSHIVTSLRVETMMAGLHTDAEVVIGTWVDVPRALESGERLEPRVVGQSPARIRAERAGFVQAVNSSHLAGWAHDAGVLVRVDVVAGEHVLSGQVLARVWGIDQTDLAAAKVARDFLVGFERTPDQDPEFGIVQLVDIALRAMSPSLHDPTTAVHALGHLASLLTDVATAPDGVDIVVRDEEDNARVWLATRSLTDFLQTTCKPVVRVAADDPDVMAANTRLLGAVRRSGGPASHDAVDEELAYVERCVRRTMTDEADLERVLDDITAARRPAEDG